MNAFSCMCSGSLVTTHVKASEQFSAYCNGMGKYLDVVIDRLPSAIFTFLIASTLIRLRSVSFIGF